MFCQNCQNTYRTRQQAKALVKIFGNSSTKSLSELINNPLFRSLKIAEINACGNLHHILKKLPNLYYSEYQGYKKIEGVKSEDLQYLSYKNNFFDLVLTSDTLEHIPNLEKSLGEIYRVLKKGSYHVFTIPVIFDRKTQERINVGKTGVVRYLLPESFHGSGERENLVYREFGMDVLELLGKFGYKIHVYFFNILNDDYSYVFVCQKM